MVNITLAQPATSSSILSFIHSFIHSIMHPAVCLTSGPQSPPKPFPHRIRVNPSSFNLRYPLFSLRSSSSSLHLLRRLPVTSTTPSIFPSITCFRRQFLSKKRPIQLAFLLFLRCSYFRYGLPVTRHESKDWGVRLLLSLTSVLEEGGRSKLQAGTHCIEGWVGATADLDG